MAILTAFASMVGRYDLEDEVEFLNKLAFGSMTEAEFFEEYARLKAEGKVRDPKKEGKDVQFHAAWNMFVKIKEALPLEKGNTPLFTKSFNSVEEISKELEDIYNSFPDKVVAADGSTVYLRQDDSEGSRFDHLIMRKGSRAQGRTIAGITTKIPWLPRLVETLENAQAKIEDRFTGNYAYVRAYDEGFIHTVIVSRDGSVVDTEVFDHNLITQFADRFAQPNKRDGFIVVWEKSTVDAPAPASVSTASTMGASVPSWQDKDTPSLKNVKPKIEKNSKKRYNFIEYSDSSQL